MLDAAVPLGTLANSVSIMTIRKHDSEARNRATYAPTRDADQASVFARRLAAKRAEIERLADQPAELPAAEVDLLGALVTR